MENIRTRRLSHLFKEKIGTMIITGEIKDPRIDKLISIVDIEVSNDVKYARIYTSYYGEKERHQEMVDALNHAAGFIQGLLGKRIKLKNVPKLTFIADDSIERGFRITQKLKDIMG